ncbi:DUF2332 domain-containing protein [Microbacterium oryzae]|uniref:DUF2332 domain-containing protein n=1 Tax=Microbacterium oryzae TaxID=743009 RepID=UPI0025B21F33|nr:DUF2332 domain-containing protein [Microbacterium oryzae]MDN3311051.1 DUF2332 domain-containing protein [Microbacterium oryzae]
MDEVEQVRERFARFAADEAPGRSHVYEEYALEVASDDALAGVLARIPAAHRQPPLVFAVTRLLGAPLDPADWAAFVLAHADEIVGECARRSLQTNEPLRCAALLPALSLVDGPIALLELGASGGLCLYPDRYSYRYADSAGGRMAVDPADGPSCVVLSAEWAGPRASLRVPEIVWRAGIDLEPRDPCSDADRAWLTTLVWPGEHGRRERIEAALDIAAADPPLLVSGDAGDVALLRTVAAGAPREATLVISTPGVLPYLPRARRDALITAIREMDARWITLDAPGLHGGWTEPIDRGTWPGGFALALDGRVLAAADSLGARVEWRA